MTQVLPSNSANVGNGASWEACLVAAVALTLCLSGNESAHATTGGSPYEVPKIVDINPDPNIVETILVAEEANVSIGNDVQAKKVMTFKSCASLDLCDGVVGTIPGPEFRLKVNDTVIVHFFNRLNRPTGIHWHGLELNNASDGTPLTQDMVVKGKGEFVYKFKVPRPGIFWYHPHHHSATNQVFKGLYGSLIVADPLEAGLQGGILPSAAQTKTLVLSDITVCKKKGSNDTVTFDLSLPHPEVPLRENNAPTPYDLCEGTPIDEDGNLTSVFNAGEVPNIMHVGPGPVGEGQTVLTNGVNVGGRAGTPASPGALASGASTLNVQPGQGLRLQIINAAATRYVRLLLTGSNGVQIPLVRIGGQGGLLDSPRLEGGVINGFRFNYATGEILIPPGSREDVVAAIPGGASGVLTLWTQDFKRTGAGFAWLPTVPVMHLNVAGDQVNPAYQIAAGTALRPAGSPVEDLSLITAAQLLSPPDGLPGIGPGPDITFTNSGSTLGVNDIEGDHDHSTRPFSARYAKLGDTLELKVTNITGAHHPFHLHGFSVQPISLTDTLTDSDFANRSTPNVSPGTGPSYVFPYHEFRDEIDIPGGYTLTFRVRLDDRPNLYDSTTPGGVGRWLLHCHVLFHATMGMISELDVVPPTN